MNRQVRRTGSARSCARGTAAVELALVLPVFLMVLLGTAELGRALYQYNTLNASVRDGAQFLARYSVVAGYVTLSHKINDTDTNTVEQTARNLIVYGVPTLTGACATTPASCALLKGMDPDADVTITAVTPAGAGGPTYVKVDGQYKFLKLFAFLPTFGFGGNVAEPGTMKASVTMAGLGP